MTKFGQWIKKINNTGINNDKLKFVNFVVVSDSDDSYLKKEWKAKAKKIRLIYIILIFLVVLISFFPLFLPPNEQTKWTQSYLNIGINIFVFVVLILDYFLRWITYPIRAGKFSSIPLLFFPLTGISLLMIISLLPTTFSVFAKFINENDPFVKLINVFSIVKIIRLLLLLKVIPTFNIFSKNFAKNKFLLINVFIFVFIMAIIFSLLIYSVEGGTKWISVEEYAALNGIEVDKIPPNIIKNGKIEVPINNKILNFGDALYFTFVTITTIGYGDITPATSLGRVVVIINAILGIIIFAIPSGIITGSFIVEIQEKYKNKKNIHKQKEIEKLSFAEKFYIGMKSRAINLINKNNEHKKSKIKKLIIENNANQEQNNIIYEKLANKLEQTNIKNYSINDKKIEIDILNIEEIDENFFKLIELLELEWKIK